MLFYKKNRLILEMNRFSNVNGKQPIYFDS